MFTGRTVGSGRLSGVMEEGLSTLRGRVSLSVVGCL